MEKIFKKSLALMVSAALCLTAFVGCLTVNAEATATPTYTITAQNGKAGDTVTVNVYGNNLTSVCGQQVFINIPAALTIASVKDNAGNPYINVANVTEGEAFDYSVVTTETTKQVRFADIINFPATGSDGAIATAEFHIVFELTIPAAAEVGAKYDIAFDTATMFADIDENAIGITVEPKTITVQAAQPACEHVWEFVSAIPATGSDNSTNTEYTKGSITFKCADCGEEKTEVVNYSYYSRAQDSGLEYGSETLMRFGTRYENDHPRIATDANITDGYIVLTQKRLDTTVATKATQIKDCESTVNSNGQKIYQTRIGIPALAMSDDVTSVFYAYDSTSDAWYSGYQVTYSVKTAAEGILSTSTKDLQKTALVNLLNYGAAAQDYFATKEGYTELNDVVRSNAGIDSYQSYAIEADPFDTSSMNLVYQDDGSFVFCFNKANLIVDSKTTNRIFFRIPSSYSGASTAVDMTGYTVEVTYTDFLGEQQTEIYTADQFMPEGRVNRFYIEAPFATPDLRQVATFVVKNPDGEVAGPASTASIANIAASIISTSTDSNQTSMINNLMAFSDAAYDYLTTKN